MTHFPCKWWEKTGGGNPKTTSDLARPQDCESVPRAACEGTTGGPLRPIVICHLNPRELNPVSNAACNSRSPRILTLDFRSPSSFEALHPPPRVFKAPNAVSPRPHAIAIEDIHAPVLLEVSAGGSLCCAHPTTIPIQPPNNFVFEEEISEL